MENGLYDPHLIVAHSGSCFDRACPELAEGLSTNGGSPRTKPTLLTPSLSKGELQKHY